MKDEEINAAISKAIGKESFQTHLWDERDDRRYFICQRCAESIGWGDYSKEKGVFSDSCRGDDKDYCNDLNAISEVEEKLTQEQRDRCYGEVWKIIRSLPPTNDCQQIENAWLVYHATARQHSEAFLRAIGKWTA